MAKQSRLEAMRANPKGDWTMADVAAVCHEHGVKCEPARGGGSHWKIYVTARRMTVPARRPIKPVYIRALVRFIDEGRS